MRLHDSQAYREMGATRERISRVLELREILLSFQIGFNLVSAAVVCAVLESISGLEPSSVTSEPWYLKLVTVSLSALNNGKSLQLSRGLTKPLEIGIFLF